MEQTFTYQTSDVCSRSITIVYEGDTVKKVTFVGGCPGNTLGVSRLVEGRKMDEVIALLGNIVCPGSRTRKTSCPMQLSLALKQIQQNRE